MTRSAFATFRLTATIGLLAYIACKGEKTVDPSVATTIAASSSTALTGVAGSTVSPAILVKDQNGAPMAGATVNLLVLSGGGSVSGATVTTDASGIATASWTLGTTAGPNALNMWTGTLTAITFTATGTAGAAASLTKSAGDNQAGTAGVAVPVSPSVVVKDANGNAKADVVVTFAVASGGGSVIGGTATSNSAGTATVGSWTLGAAPGTNTLTASAPGVAAVTFTAMASPNLCATATTHTLGATSNGALATTDCLLDGYYYDFFITTLADANAYVFRQSAAFDAYLLLITPDGNLIAENDDETDATTNSAIKVLLPPGTFVLGASSFDKAITGDYVVTSGTTSSDVRGCEEVFIVSNVSTNQNVEATDCISAPAPNSIYSDHYFIFLESGQSVTASMSSSAVDSYLELRRGDETGPIVMSNDNKDTSGTKDARVVYTVTTTSYYTIVARTAVIGQTGAYTLQIQ